jgi:stringent starvation protein B|tara:strand:- start:46 stop:426 length:381 start_codon:yes stop_codon:yes gene_type:complete
MASSTKPYLIRSIYDWCTDSNFTPYIVAKIISGVKAPATHVKSKEIVLNLSLASTNKLIFDNDFISFSARFDGKNQDIFLPMESISAIYSKENGEGLFFEVDEKITKKETKNIEKKTKKPYLSLVK